MRSSKNLEVRILSSSYSRQITGIKMKKKSLQANNKQMTKNYLLRWRAKENVGNACWQMNKRWTWQMIHRERKWWRHVRWDRWHSNNAEVHSMEGETLNAKRHQQGSAELRPKAYIKCKKSSILRRRETSH